MYLYKFAAAANVQFVCMQKSCAPAGPSCPRRRDATATSEFAGATFSVDVKYQGKSLGGHSFDICMAGALHVDGIPKCPWAPGTKLHVIDRNPRPPAGAPLGPYVGTWKMVDKKGAQLFCMQTNWTFAAAN